MITEFKDGFITKTKLNELVDGINANSEDIVDINVRILTADVTKTVGSGGYFATITEAFEWCSRVIPTKYKVTLQLLTGFTWSELVTINDVDFGFVILTSVDNTVNTSLSPVSSGFAFTATNSVCPMWKILLNGGNS